MSDTNFQLIFSTYRYEFSRVAPGLFFSGNARGRRGSGDRRQARKGERHGGPEERRAGEDGVAQVTYGVVESESSWAYAEASAIYLVQSSRFQVPGSTLNLELLLNIEQGKPLNREL